MEQNDYKLEDFSRMAKVFGNTVLIANHLQTIIDRDLDPHGLTAKQWFLIACMHEFFTEPPRLGDLARVMGTSYQNVKQLALKLEKINFVKISSDPTDQRALRIETTPQCSVFFEEHNSNAIQLMLKVFSSLSPDDLNSLFRITSQWADGIKGLKE